MAMQTVLRVRQALGQDFNRCSMRLLTQEVAAHHLATARNGSEREGGDFLWSGRGPGRGPGRVSAGARKHEPETFPGPAIVLQLYHTGFGMRTNRKKGLD